MIVFVAKLLVIIYPYAKSIIRLQYIIKFLVAWLMTILILVAHRLLAYTFHIIPMSNWSPSSLHFSRRVIVAASTWMSLRCLNVTLFRRTTPDARSSAISDPSTHVPHREATISPKIRLFILSDSNVITCNRGHNGG